MIFSNIYYVKAEENELKHYSTAEPSNRFMFDMHKNDYKHSSHEQINYNKLNYQHEMPINFDDKSENNTGTLSLHTLSVDNRNNTINSKTNNILLKKLKIINKKLKKTLKQLQTSTSKSFINFNFNYTQLKDLYEPIYSSTSNTTSVFNLLCNTKSKNNSQIKKQKNSKSNNSNNNYSISKLYLDYLKYFQKNMIKKNSSSFHTAVVDKINLSSKNIKNNKNIMDKNNQELIILKQSTFGINIRKIQSTNYNCDSSILLNKRSISKNTMKLNEKTKTNSVLSSLNESNKAKANEGIINETILNNKNLKNENHENKKKNEKETTIENEAHSLKTLKFEKNLFSSPEGIALILFILYATYMF